MHDEEGFTLVELLVATVLVMVVGMISFAFVDQVTTASSTTSRQLVSQGEAQATLREMTQEVRGANPISAIYPTTGSCPAAGGTVGFPPTTSNGTGYLNCLRFALTTSTDATKFCVTNEFGRVPAPYRVVTYGLVSGTLYKHITSYGATCAGTVPAGPGRVVLSGLTNATHGKPLFTYFDGTGTKIADNQTVVDAGSVRITLMVPYDANAPHLELTSVAAFRNS